MISENAKERILATLVGFCIGGLVLLIWIAHSLGEAKAFNELTGKHITISQAMFLSLRIQESVLEHQMVQAGDGSGICDSVNHSIGGGY